MVLDGLSAEHSMAWWWACSPCSSMVTKRAWEVSASVASSQHCSEHQHCQRFNQQQKNKGAADSPAFSATVSFPWHRAPSCLHSTVSLLRMSQIPLQHSPYHTALCWHVHAVLQASRTPTVCWSWGIHPAGPAHPQMEVSTNRDSHPHWLLCAVPHGHGQDRHADR
jgi:hypothetical protein